MSSIKTNVLYSSILTVANYLFPLITYPYVNRVLGVTNIGTCNFVDSIVSYYILFSMLGMTTMGIREIAKAKDKGQEELSSTFSGLMLINGISTLIAIVALVGSIFLVPKFRDYSDLLIVGVFKVLFNYLLIEWFYRGLEDFKYITNRSILVRILYVVLIFIFVREPEDYLLYYVLTVATIVLNALINIVYSKKFVSFKLSRLTIKPYIKPFIILGVYGLLTSMYTTFNSAYLGFVANDTEVGYYTTATRLHVFILALFTAFTSVMMPRLSNLASKGSMEEFRELCSKSVLILYTFSFPVMVYCFCFSTEIIDVLAGGGFEKASVCFQVIIPNVLIVGLEQIFITQVLLTLSKDKAVLINSIIGATIGLVSNFVLVSGFQSVGSSIVWLFSELSVLLSAIYFVNRIDSSFLTPLKGMIREVLLAIPILVVLFFLAGHNAHSVVKLLLGLFVLCLYYYVVYYHFVKNSIVLYVMDSLKHRFFQKII